MKHARTYITVDTTGAGKVRVEGSEFTRKDGGNEVWLILSPSEVAWLIASLQLALVQTVEE